MHLWTRETWKKYYDLADPRLRSGVRIRFEPGVDLEVRRACKEFLVWLRRSYVFPIRVPIYIKQTAQINALAAILTSIAHELTHYFQWINDLCPDGGQCERQATTYAHKMLASYAQTRDHP